MTAGAKKSSIRKLLESEARGLGVVFDETTSDDVLRQRISTSPQTKKQQADAAALGIGLDGELNYGGAKNKLAGHKRTAGAKCIKEGGWEVGVWLEYDGKLIVLLAVDKNKGTVAGRVYDKLRRGKDHLPFLPWENLPNTPAHDLRGAVVVNPDKLPNVIGHM